VSIGSQTVTFVTISQGTEGRFEHEPVRTPVDVPGCLFRPLVGSESVTETDIITRPWECIAPPVAAAVNADATGELEYNDQTYKITSVEPHPDFSRPVHHVTVTAERTPS
jgi:hypothetical protein